MVAPLHKDVERAHPCAFRRRCGGILRSMIACFREGAGAIIVPHLIRVDLRLSIEL